MEKTIKYYNNKPVLVLEKHPLTDFYQIRVDLEISDVDLDYIAESYRGCDACMVGHKSTCYCTDKVNEVSDLLNQIMEDSKISVSNLFWVEGKDLKDKPFEWAENEKLKQGILKNKDILNGLVDIIAESKSLIKAQEKQLKDNEDSIRKSDAIVENRKALSKISDKEYEDSRLSINLLKEQKTKITVEKSDIELSYKDYKNLLERDELLSALEAGGVNNWEWYGESTKHLYENEE